MNLDIYGVLLQGKPPRCRLNPGFPPFGIHGRSNNSSTYNLNVAKKVFSFVEEIVENSGTDLETISTLEFDMDGDIDIYTDTYGELGCDSDSLNSDSFDVEQDSDSLSQQVSQEWVEEVVDGAVFTYQEMVNILDFYDKVKKHKFNQAKRRYKKIKNSKTITRLRAYVEHKSTTFQKFKQVEKFVLERFENARSSMMHVNEMDLRRWAMSKSSEIDLNFKASPKWIMDFKYLQFDIYENEAIKEHWKLGYAVVFTENFRGVSNYTAWISNPTKFYHYLKTKAGEYTSLHIFIYRPDHPTPQDDPVLKTYKGPMLEIGGNCKKP
ncbi:hypothetical protein Fcan01_23243 [Folsomia candida]|uniref:Uncharacterized protein n=1 Tax=Folsomia candida TaxID=158441 RepID=A0A226DA64_FOLCA|nr:hypothetical protein Fcan01_23243 [Folsomia candida]